MDYWKENWFIWNITKIRRPQRDALIFLLGVTILHEYVNYGDNIDGIDQPGEEGLLFEIATYGETIWLNNAQDVLIKWQQD